MQGADVKVETNALNLRWAFGFNTSVPNAVHSLSTPKRNALFYVSSHTGVIHDTEHDQQYLLQGHCNPITAVCVSADKRWIATADSGEESMIVVWDAFKACPVKIIPHPFKGGVAAMDMSTDSMFLVTLSQSYPQHIAVWEWTVATQEPAISASIGDHEYQHCVRFNPVDVRDIVSNGQRKVIFWNWTQDSIAAFHPPRGIRKLKKSIGLLTQTMFIPYTTKAVTATASGHVVLWDYPVSELAQSSGRDAIKILKICAKTGINLISSVLDRYVVCGCQDGAVRFFDFQFRVVAWFEDIQQNPEDGEVTSVSFAQSVLPQSAPSNTGNVSMDDFEVPNFVVSTSDGKIIELNSKAMDHIQEEMRQGKRLVQGFDGDVVTLDAHPSLPLFAAGTNAGTLQIWDLDDRQVTCSRKFEGKHDGSLICCVKFGPKGDLLAVGFSDGSLKLVSAQDAANVDVHSVDSQALPDVCVFKYSTGAITEISWSPDGQYFATADEDRCIGLYRYFHRDEEKDKPVEWIFVGKCRAHYRRITSVYFEVGRMDIAALQEEEKMRLKQEEKRLKSLNTDQHDDDGDGLGNTLEKEEKKLAEIKAREEAKIHAALAIAEAERKLAQSIPRLFSLGEDRVLQEFDVGNSSIRKGLQILHSTRVEQVATPTSFVSIRGERNRVRRRDLGNNSSDSSATGTSSSGADDDDSANYTWEYRPDVIVTANDEYKLKVWDLSSPAAAEEAEARKRLRFAIIEEKRRERLAKRREEGLDEEMDEEEDDEEFLEELRKEEEADNGTVAKICVKTLLAPTYGGPITKLFVLPKRDGTQVIPSQFLVYATQEKVVGLIKLPLDGNPNKAMALIAHPAEIAAVTCSFDGRYLITAGGLSGDRSVNLWMVSTSALEASIQLGGSGIQPYMGLIEGGNDGEFYQDLLDYFYYAQLRSQGVLTTKPREITGFIPVDQVINLMRALGHYPTESEVRDIKTEIRFSHLNLAPNLRDKVDLEEFIKLFVNYRPVFGLGKEQFREAFKILVEGLQGQHGAQGASDGDNTDGPIISRDDLLDKLNTMGEILTDDELLKCFEILLSTPDNRVQMADRGPFALLSDTISPSAFAHDILGFEDYSDPDAVRKDEDAVQRILGGASGPPDL